MELTQLEKDFIFEEAWDEITNSKEFNDKLDEIIAELTAIKILEKRALVLHFK